METPLAAKDILLWSNKTKENLIQLIAVDLIHRTKMSFNSKNILVITSKSSFAAQSQNTVKITRYDLKAVFDEAAYIIPNQLVTPSQEGKQTMKVISTDTDVFLTLCHFWKSMNMDAEF